ncbi:Uncharacterised protein [Mycobacteroides abscessus subsp. abscessus]|nr:Uncharacterised protein [Mycobacteroides abscessus subsp. abscessus]
MLRSTPSWDGSWPRPNSAAQAAASELVARVRNSRWTALRAWGSRTRRSSSLTGSALGVAIAVDGREVHSPRAIR